jgi:hypothetical protein
MRFCPGHCAVLRKQARRGGCGVVPGSSLPHLSGHTTVNLMGKGFIAAHCHAGQ